MAKRTLTAKMLKFHKANAHESTAETYAPSDLEGRNLLQLFIEWLNSHQNFFLEYAISSNKYTKIINVDRIDKNFLLIHTMSGKGGESGTIYSLREDIAKYNINEDEIPTGHARVALYVPSRGETALIFSENNNRGNPGIPILAALKASLKQICPNITIDSQTVIEGAEWLKTIQAVKDIEVKTYDIPIDTSSCLDSQPQSLSFLLKPKPRMRFPKRIIYQLRQSKANVPSILGIPTSSTGDLDVFVTAETIDGRTKKINVFSEDDFPFFRLVLNENDRPEITDQEFIKISSSKARDILKGLGEIL